MPEDRGIILFREELREAVKDVLDALKDFSGTILESEEIISAKFAASLEDLIKSVSQLNELLRHKRVLREGYKTRLEEVIKIYEDLRKEVEKLPESLKRSFEDVKSSFVDLKEIAIGSGGALKRLEEGIPLSQLGDLGETVSSVGVILKRWLGITVPLAVADMLKDLYKGIRDFNLGMLELQQTFSFAFVQAGEMAHLSLDAISLALRGLAHHLRMSERDVLTLFTQLRESGLLYITDQGRWMLRLQDAYSRGEVSVMTFASSIMETMAKLRELAIAFGMTERQIVTFAEHWRRLMMVTDIEETYRVLTMFQRVARESGISVDELNKFMQQLIERTRLYGLDVYDLIGTTERYIGLIRDGILTVQDFTNALVRARESISPDRAGTMLWFLANFATEKDIKEISNRLLQFGAEGIYAFTYLLGTPWETIRKTYDQMDERTRRLVDSLVEVIEKATGVRLNFEQLSELGIKFQQQVIPAVFDAMGRFGEGSMRYVLALEVLRDMSLTTSYNLFDVIKQHMILSSTVQDLSSSQARAMKATEDYSEIIRKAEEVVKNFVDVGTRFVGNIDILRAKIEEQIDRWPTIPEEAVQAKHTPSVPDVLIRRW